MRNTLRIELRLIENHELNSTLRHTATAAKPPALDGAVLIVELTGYTKPSPRRMVSYISNIPR